MKTNKLSSTLINDVIGMAWCDKTSFEMIKEHTGLTHNDVKQLMREQLKPSSYRMWRKRVVKKPMKNQKRNKVRREYTN